MLVPVNVIATFEEEEQAWFDTDVAIHPRDTQSEKEYDAVSQVIVDLQTSGERDMDYLVKLSLAYTLEPSLHSDGFGFIYRTNSKYYFQPNQTDEFEEKLKKDFGVASLTKRFELEPSLRRTKPIR